MFTDQYLFISLFCLLRKYLPSGLVIANLINISAVCIYHEVLRGQVVDALGCLLLGQHHCRFIHLRACEDDGIEIASRRSG